ncbi:MAG TPA: hypothetical protein VGC63_04975 [Solirubrobacterales bacterium]|jgi:hypothetical protein
MTQLRDPQGLQVIDPILTNLAIAYMPQGFIYDQLVPKIDVKKNAGQYPVWSLDDLLRDDVESKVDARAETPEIDLSFTMESYLLQNYRLKVSITPEDREQAADELKLETRKTKFLLGRMLLRRERRLAVLLRKTTNGGAITLGGGVTKKWGEKEATIELDIKGARKAVYDFTGQHVDSMLINWDVAYAMALDPAIREIIKYTVPGELIISKGEAILPKVLHGLNVVIADGTKFNTARKGAARSLSNIWSDNVILFKRGEDNELEEPSTLKGLYGQVAATNEGRTSRSQSTGGGHFAIDKWATADPPVDYIRAWEKVQEKLTAPDVAYEIADVL